MGKIVTETTSVTDASTHITGYAAGTVPPGVNVYVRRLLLNSRTRDLTSNPGWRESQIKNGYAPLSPYKASWIDRSYSPGSASWWQNQSGVNRPSGRTCTVDFRILTGLPAGLEPKFIQWKQSDMRWTNQRNEALTQMYERLADMDLAVPELLWETRKTIDMFAKMVKTIIEAARDVRRYRFKLAARRLGIGTPLGASRRRTFSKNWMEYRYGWLPLYYSAYDAMVALYNLSRKPVVRHVKGRSASAQSSSGEWTYGVGGESLASNESMYSRPPSTVRWSVRKQATSRHTTECGVIVRLTSPAQGTLGNFGLTNPSQVWAVVPMSWFADWWVDVTGFLTQFGALMGKEVVGYYETRTARYSNAATTTSITGPTGKQATTYKWTASGAQYTVQNGWTERVVKPHPPMAGPILGSGLNGLHRFLDVISLLRGTLKN